MFSLRLSTCSRRLFTFTNVKSYYSSSATRSIWASSYSLPSLSTHTRLSSLIDVRFVRSRAGSDHQSSADKPHEPEEEQSKNTEEDAKQDGDKKGPIDPALMKKLRMYVLAVGCLSFVTSFLILSQMWHEGTGFPPGTNAEHFTKTGIDFQTFATKYLNTGEVRQILFCPQQQRALAFLHDGAIIDRRIVSDPVVVINYTQNAQQFWADVRKEEASMGISLHDGVKIDMYKGLTTFKVIEMVIGVLIIAWLGTQYGRLLRKRFIQNKAQKQGLGK